VFYLGQTYSKIPKQLVMRDKVNFLFIFWQDNTNLRHIYVEFVGGDFSFDDFSSICSEPGTWLYYHRSYTKEKWWQISQQDQELYCFFIFYKLS
jgi:hypothetical protein